jgi:arginase family enzyme
MIFSDYFNPVSLEKPQNELLLNNRLFCRHIDIHTPDIEPKDLSKYKIAIIGITESRGCNNVEVDFAADEIRNQLYQLNFPEKKINIIDLGNLKLGKELKDTYFALRDVLLELLQYNICPIVVGGSQDITYGIYLAFEYLKKHYTLSTIDFRVDVAFEAYDSISFNNFLNPIILENKNLFEFINIGHQACFANIDNVDLFENLFHETLRLGILRNNTQLAEPYLRDSDIVSFDFSSLKHADAPGQLIASPNGFNAEDACQLLRYAGFGEKIKILGLFNINPTIDENKVTSNLAAQCIWYFLDGYSIKINESPLDHPDDFKKYFVSLDDENQIIFYNSLLTQRWWIAVPTKEKNDYIAACNEKDYLMALKGEIPDRWLKLLKKLN